MSIDEAGPPDAPAGDPPRATRPDDVVLQLRAAGVRAGDPVALAHASDGLGLAVRGRSLAVTVDVGAACDVVRVVAADLAPRWVWWSARVDARPLVAAGLRLTACWDLAAVHRLLHGGSHDDPARVWAAVHGLPTAGLPRTGQLDLLANDGGDDGDPGSPVRPDGYLRPEWAERPPTSAHRAARWAGLALQVRDAQDRALADLPDGRPVRLDPALALLTARSESAAEMLAVELGARGLPLSRDVAGSLVARHVGERPADAAAAAAARTRRDDDVRRHVPGSDEVDLRNPAQVRGLLARIGIDVPDTRSWRLEPLREAHPAVEALLTWRKAERIATTYGYAWLDRHVGVDGRLRGAWSGSDGAAGRMTAQAGLHNLPAELRAAVVAEPGHVFVRADLGQVEPRVLAAVSGDEALARATAEPDLYSPVAARLGCDRPTAKVAVLAAMYGQTSGTAGAALRGLDRAYPVAMRYLRAADETGSAGRDVRTYGGRLVRMWSVAPSADGPDRAAMAARGRFARNAVVQGAAAELFKMWAVTVRAGLSPDAGEIVLCLHDELLVHADERHAEEVAALLESTLAATAARWAAGSGVRFGADIALVPRWSDAKA